MKTIRPNSDYEREERIAIKIDSHIPIYDAITQTDKEQGNEVVEGKVIHIATGEIIY